MGVYLTIHIYIYIYRYMSPGLADKSEGVCIWIWGHIWQYRPIWRMECVRMHNWRFLKNDVEMWHCNLLNKDILLYMYINMCIYIYIYTDIHFSLGEREFQMTASVFFLIWGCQGFCSICFPIYIYIYIWVVEYPPMHCSLPCRDITPLKCRKGVGMA